MPFEVKAFKLDVEEEHIKNVLCLVMAFHKRLGQASSLRFLSVDIVQKIEKMMRPVWVYPVRVFPYMSEWIEHSKRQGYFPTGSNSMMDAVDPVTDLIVKNGGNPEEIEIVYRALVFSCEFSWADAMGGGGTPEERGDVLIWKGEFPLPVLFTSTSSIRYVQRRQTQAGVERLTVVVTRKFREQIFEVLWSVYGGRFGVKTKTKSIAMVQSHVSAPPVIMERYGIRVRIDCKAADEAESSTDALELELGGGAPNYNNDSAPAQA